MAIVKPNSIVTCIRGKLSKKDDVVFYWKYGKNFVWRNEGFHGPYSADQLDAQSLFSQAVAAKTTALANPTQAAQYRANFKAQSKYQTFSGYLMAECIKQIKLARQNANQGDENPD